MPNEIYSVDIDTTTKRIICGGQNDLASVYSYEEGQQLSIVDGFEDSVVFSKFLAVGRCLIVSIDGMMIITEDNAEIESLNLEETVTAVHATSLDRCDTDRHDSDNDSSNGYILVGTESGRVYVYSYDLEHINTFGGHQSEVIALSYESIAGEPSAGESKEHSQPQSSRFLSLSNENLLVHDYYGRLLYAIKATEAFAFKYVGGDVVSIGREKKIQIFKETKKLFEMSLEGSIDAIELVEKSLVVTGDFKYVLLVDTTCHYAIFRIPVDVRILKMKRVAEYKVAFSTACGNIGLMDIRRAGINIQDQVGGASGQFEGVSKLKNSNFEANGQFERNQQGLVIYDLPFESIFDFSVSGRELIVGGDSGFIVMDLEGKVIYEERIEEGLCENGEDEEEGLCEDDEENE